MVVGEVEGVFLNGIQVEGFFNVWDGLAVLSEGVEEASGLAVETPQEVEVVVGGDAEGVLEVAEGCGEVAEVAVDASAVVQGLGVVVGVVVLVVSHHAENQAVGGVGDVGFVARFHR